jgi:hypothetical protein
MRGWGDGWLAENGFVETRMDGRWDAECQFAIPRVRYSSADGC